MTAQDRFTVLCAFAAKLYLLAKDADEFGAATGDRRDQQIASLLYTVWDTVDMAVEAALGKFDQLDPAVQLALIDQPALDAN